MKRHPVLGIKLVTKEHFIVISVENISYIKKHNTIIKTVLESKAERKSMGMSDGGWVGNENQVAWLYCENKG